jgi:hypothetical protein
MDIYYHHLMEINKVLVLRTFLSVHENGRGVHLHWNLLYIWNFIDIRKVCSVEEGVCVCVCVCMKERN